MISLIEFFHLLNEKCFLTGVGHSICKFRTKMVIFDEKRSWKRYQMCKKKRNIQIQVEIPKFFDLTSKTEKITKSSFGEIFSPIRRVQTEKCNLISKSTS